jgi:hypothetical protein
MPGPHWHWQWHVGPPLAVACWPPLAVAVAARAPLAAGAPWDWAGVARPCPRKQGQLPLQVAPASPAPFSFDSELCGPLGSGSGRHRDWQTPGLGRARLAGGSGGMHTAVYAREPPASSSGLSSRGPRAGTAGFVHTRLKSTGRHHGCTRK